MVVLHPALLSILLPAAVLARPNQHEKLHHKRHGQENGPYGVHGGPAALSHPSESSTAPYPTGNQTFAAPTGTGTGVNSGPTTVTISSIIEVFPVPVTSGGSPISSSASSPGSPAQPGSPNGPGGAGSPDQCGPATVTVTSAKTVTVTVAGSGSQPSSPPSSSAAPAQPSSPPSSPSSPAQPASPPSSSSSPSQPAVAPAASPSKEAKPTAEEKNKTPPSSTPNTKPDTTSKQASSPSASPSDTPKKSPTGGKKGILYKDISQANAMSGHVSWGCNWDSSPIPAVGHASGSLGQGLAFVPQLWGPQDVHTSIWSGNSQGAAYVMAFNEPNQPQGAGGCGPMSASDAIAPYEQHFKGNKDAGQKIVSPCVSNEAHEWLETFISGTKLKPDAVCFHWYGMNLKELQGVVSTFAAIQSKHNIPELWMSEFALNADLPTNDAKKLLDWLDSESGVDRYAYNNEKLPTTPGVKQAYCGSS